MGKYYLGTGNQQINFQVVDSTGVISDLNLSGLYLSITGKAADADKLDNFDSSFFRNAQNLTGIYTGQISGSIGNADTLDGLDSSYFLNGANITGTVALSGTFTGYYTGAFSGTITHTDSITFHTGLGINPDPAELTWSDDVGTMQLGLQGGNIDLRVGLQNYEYVTNRNASTLSKGSVVYISGAQGNRPAVALALANADSTSAVTFGILAEDIAPTANGYAITNGLLTNLNTTGFAEGAALYLSPTVSGAVISSKPQAPNHSVLVGFCVRSHASAGEILVKIQNGVELDELHDVRIISAQNNDIIRYNAPSGVWFNSNTLALNGTGSHYISGDLGIGTSSPSAKLHIFGADKRQIITSTTDNAALVLGQWDGTTNRIESSTRKLLLTSYANGISLGINGSENVHVSPSGYLGVGTTSPQFKLDVNGIASIAQSYYLNKGFADGVEEYLIRGSAGSWNGFISYTPSSSTANRGFKFGAWDNGGNRNDWVSIWNGNVGIGTTSPGYKLDIQGGSIRVLDNAGPVINLSDNSTRNWDIGLNATTDAFYIRDVVAAATRMTIDTSGSTTFDGQLTLMGSKLAFTDDGTNINATVASRRLQLVATGSSVVTGYNTDFYFSNETSVAKYNGNVGIGITNPTNKLEIATGNSATTGIRVRDSANGVWTDIYRATIKFFGGGGVIDTNDTTDAIDIRQAGNSRLFIAQSNSTYNGVSVGGWVGIGTSAPSQRLEVLGDLDMAGLKVTTTTGRGRITVASQTISHSSYLELNSGESQIAFLDGNYNSNRLRIATNRTGAYIAFETDAQSEKMRITSSGNVGIGTTSPSSLLHLHGNTNSWSTSPTIVMSSSSANANVRNWRIGPADTVHGNFHIGVSDTLGGLVDTDAEANAFTISYDKKVGIGTITPYDKLEVAGGIAATGYTTGNASQAHATLIGVNGGTSYLQAVDWGAEFKPLVIEGKTISLQTGTGSTSSRFYIDNSGNVGIGITSPEAKLDVSGTIAGTNLYGQIGHSSGGRVRFWADTAGQNFISNYWVTYNNTNTRWEWNATTSVGGVRLDFPNSGVFAVNVKSSAAVTAGNPVNFVTGLSVSDTTTTVGGNLTVSGTTSTITLGSTNTGSIAVDSNGGLTITPKAGQALTLAGASSIKAGVGYAGLAEISNGLYFGGASYAFAQGDSGDTYVNAKSGQSVYLRVNNTTVAQGSAGAFSVAGNLTVSGTGGITSSSTSPLLKATTSALGAVPKLTLENTNLGAWNVYLSGTDGGDFKIDQDSTNKFRIAFGTGNATLAGNLTVSGGTIGTAASTDLVVQGGSSGAALTLGQGTAGQAKFIVSSTNPVLKVSNSGQSAGALVLGDGSTTAFNVGIARVPASSPQTYGGGGLGYFTQGAGNSGGHYWFSGDNSFGSQTELMRLNTTGNLLIGTVIDGGQKLQVAGTAYVSGDATFAGTNVVLSGTGTREIKAVSTNNGQTSFVLDGGSGNAWSIYKPASSTDIRFYGNGADRLTLTNAGDATFAGTVKSSVSAGSRTIQSTPTVTVAPDAVQNLVSQNYGFFLVNENSLTGSIAIIGFNSGGTYIVWQEGTNYSATANTASKFNVYYSAGTQLVVQNKKASNAVFNIINLAGGS